MSESTPAAGHNSGTQVKSFIERLERLEEEKKSFADDIRDVFAEAKGVGIDVKALRVVLRRRKMDAAARAELDTVVEIYEGLFG